MSDGTIVAADKPRERQAGSAPLRRDERPPDESVSWHMQPGARELLTYCDMRNVLRLLLPSDVDSDEAAQAQAAQLARALQVPTRLVPRTPWDRTDYSQW